MNLAEGQRPPQVMVLVKRCRSANSLETSQENAQRTG
jgi:hypothetical protein